MCSQENVGTSEAGWPQRGTAGSAPFQGHGTWDTDAPIKHRRERCLAGSVGEARGSWPWGREFAPHREL